MAARNLGAVWRNFHASGARRLVAAGVVESPEVLAAYQAAVPGSRAVVCQLRAHPERLRSRMAARGRETGDGVDALWRRATQLSHALDRVGVADFTVDTDSLDVPAVARLVLTGADWPM